MNFDSMVLQVPVEDIIPNRFQPRQVFDDESLQDLAASIRQHGIIQPLVLRRMGDKYEIVAGERRYRAARIAGLSSVPAVISTVDERTSAEVALAENVQRRELTSIEEAKSYKLLLDQGLMSQEQLARKLGLSQSAVSNKLRLLNLCTEVQNAVIERKISERHARALLVIDNEEDQKKWLDKIINERLTVRQLDELIKKDFGGEVNMDNEAIDAIKNNATDLNIPTYGNTTSDNTFTSMPIDLGEKPQNKFFNSLEDEKANMQMTEAVTPLSNPVFMETTIKEETSTPVINDEIEVLDDGFNIPASSQVESKIDPEAKINELIEELKKTYQVTLTSNKNDNEFLFVISVKNN